MADETITADKRRTAWQRLGEWATYPGTIFLSRVAAGFGAALASVAVWVFFDTRDTLSKGIDNLGDKLTKLQAEIVESQRQVQSVAERVAVQQQQIINHDRELIEQQRRLNRLEQKVFP